MHLVDATLSKSYYTGLAKGIELSADSPTYKVRERLLCEKRELSHIALVENAALVIRGFNAGRPGGRPMPQGKWQGTSATFPEIS
jgi:hypothetical protein